MYRIRDQQACRDLFLRMERELKYWGAKRYRDESLVAKSLATGMLEFLLELNDAINMALEPELEPKQD